MPTAPLHPNEQRRALAVQALRMLGTPAEERFDKITRLAMRMFRVPIAVIDIVEGQRIWLKSAQGIDIIEAQRAQSYCQHALFDADTDGVCLIEDARLDPRTVDNPNNESCVFYAGVPLYHQSLPVGVLCIVDSEPRYFSSDDREALRALAEMAERELAIASLSEAQHRLAEEADALEARALVDSLTRVWNRGAILELVARELQAGLASRTPTAILLLDIDYFKKINDTYGHPAGDEALREVSSRIRAAVRPTDAVGRYGGEEFLVVLPTCPLGDLYRAAERIRTEIGALPISCAKGVSVNVTVSIGGTVSADGGHFVETLIKAADAALYRAKNEGRNRACIDAAAPSRLLRSVRPPS